MRHPRGDRSAVYPNYINATILGVILHNSFPRHYHWAKVKSTWDFSVFLLTTACEPTVTSK